MKKHTCEIKTEYPIKKYCFKFLYTKLARYYDGWNYNNECKLRDNLFPIHDIEIHIKAPVRTLPTRQTASALKWACHAGNGTYKSRLACSVAVYTP